MWQKGRGLTLPFTVETATTNYLVHQSDNSMRSKQENISRLLWTILSPTPNREHVIGANVECIPMKNCTLEVSTITKDAPNVPLVPANSTSTLSMMDQTRMSTAKDATPGSLGLQASEESCQSKVTTWWQKLFISIMSWMLQLLDWWDLKPSLQTNYMQTS